MPRSRNIKYSFFSNDELADNDPLGRLLFVGMWTLADFKGDIEWRPKRIKAELLPYDECDVTKLAINLDKSGFIRFYSVQGKMYVNITNFSKHQNPHKNERDKGSDLPEYSSKARQAVDLKGLTINRDPIDINREDSASDPADSCSLIPDSLNLIPDNLNGKNADVKSKKACGVDYSVFGMSEFQVSEVIRIRKKNKGGEITQRVANTLSKEFHDACAKGYTFDQLLDEWETRGWKSFKAEWLSSKSNGQRSDAVQRTIDNLNSVELN